MLCFWQVPRWCQYCWSGGHVLDEGLASLFCENSTNMVDVGPCSLATAPLCRCVVKWSQALLRHTGVAAFQQDFYKNRPRAGLDLWLVVGDPLFRWHLASEKSNFWTSGHFAIASLSKVGHKKKKTSASESVTLKTNIQIHCDLFLRKSCWGWKATSNKMLSK